jgi:hypothetical protein
MDRSTQNVQVIMRRSIRSPPIRVVARPPIPVARSIPKRLDSVVETLDNLKSPTIVRQSKRPFGLRQAENARDFKNPTNPFLEHIRRSPPTALHLLKTRVPELHVRHSPDRKCPRLHVQQLPGLFAPAPPFPVSRNPLYNHLKNSELDSQQPYQLKRVVPSGETHIHLNSESNRHPHIN